MKSFKQFLEEFGVCPDCKNDPCICDDSFGFVNEDGISAGPGNAVSTGAIAGTGEKGGEPGVHPKKKKSVVLQYVTRKPPNM